MSACLSGFEMDSFLRRNRKSVSNAITQFRSIPRVATQGDPFIGLRLFVGEPMLATGVLYSPRVVHLGGIAKHRVECCYVLYQLLKSRSVQRRCCFCFVFMWSCCGIFVFLSAVLLGEVFFTGMCSDEENFCEGREWVKSSLAEPGPKLVQDWFRFGSEWFCFGSNRVLFVAKN
ncbi:hypothetical protein Pan241w_44410 [Gimesia alba]|uniref:Uncharacterized protein n=1 Tax=Gimesia alba TaxID=2527973 RepID=A0A517RKH5_9PLAN|nr:hypothetical protein Pan241w_44410 [Gimesia alba]